MNENIDSQNFSQVFEKLSVRKNKLKAQIREDMQDNESEERKTSLDNQGLSKMSSLSSQQSFVIEETQEAISLNPTVTSFVQRTRPLDEFKVQLKALKTMVETNKSQENAPIYYKSQRRYTPEARAKALELATKFGAHKVSVKSGIPETTIRRWQKVGTDYKKGSGRLPTFPEIEIELMKVFREARANGILMTNNSMLREARKIAERLKNTNFVGTMSWLDGVKKRNELSYRRHTRVAQKLKENALEQQEEFRNKIIELFEKHEYQLDSVINIDETGLNFDQISNYTLEFKVLFYFTLKIIS